MIWIPIAIGIAVVAVIATTVVIIVAILNRETIRYESIGVSRANEMSAKIKQLRRSGDYNVVNVGLRDRNGNETRCIEIKSEEIERDFRAGEIIRLSI